MLPLHERLLGDCPRLKESDYRETSPSRRRCNCFGWVIGDEERPWYPRGEPDRSYWPPGIRDDFSLEAFTEAYATRGFRPSSTGASLVDGVEKIALYLDDEGEPSHAALQQPDGRWSSKMGTWEDIEHDSTTCLEGGTYGQVALFLERPRRTDDDKDTNQ